jgi:UDP-2,3-diacylglucosamine hydrolase
MHYNFFKEEFGAILYENEMQITLEGKKFYIHHGDGLVKNDLGYNILKKILRNKFLQKLFYLIHPDLGIKIASISSKTSRSYTAKKDYGEIDGLFESAKKIIDNGFDFVLFGHLHQRQYLNYKNGIYINLGSWLDSPCYGIYKDGKFEVVDWK